METPRLLKKDIEKNRRERFNRAVDKQRDICMAWDPHFARTSKLEKGDILEQMVELCRQRQQAESRLYAAIRRFDPSFNSATPDDMTTKVIEFINKVMDARDEASKTNNASSLLTISASPSKSNNASSSSDISAAPSLSNDASSSSVIAALPSLSNDDTYSDPEPTPPRVAKRKADDKAKAENNVKRPAPLNFADVTNFF